MLCDLCGKNFNDGSNLRRHKLTHNAEAKAYQCGQCDKTFARSDHLKNHVKSIHGVREEVIKNDTEPKENRFNCPKCDKSYKYKNSLQKHLNSHKMREESSRGNEIRDVERTDLGVLPVERAELEQELVGEASAQRNVEMDVEGMVEDEDGIELAVEKRFNLTCPKCSAGFSTYIRLRQHLEDEHDYKLDIEKKVFKSSTEFWMWKEAKEQEVSCSFVNRRGTRSLKSGKKYYFECHRSGVFRSNATGKRYRPEDKQTCKMGYACPATMLVTVSVDDTVHLEWSKEHFGHECDINFLRLTSTERDFIAERLKNGVSFDVILDDIRDSVETGADFKRLHLLDRRDLWNILRKVDFKHTHAHANDRISVEILVQTLAKRGDGNPVKFFKKQDKPCTCTYDSCKLGHEDFMIVLCTPYQQTEFKNYLEEKVLIDSTHGTNDYGFQLTTLSTVDSAGAGVPVMYCISSSVSTESMTLFFDIVKDTFSKESSTKVFMSDMAGEFYTAWKNVFGEAGANLFCTWHVDRRWRMKVKEKVIGLGNQVEVYRALITLRNMLDKEWFEICMVGMRIWLEEDDATKPFLEYFDKYNDRKEQWAYCCRAGLGLNTNMFSESHFKKLKYSYMKGKKLRRVDECIQILLRLTRDVAFDRLRRKFKGNNTYRSSQIISSHKKMVEMSLDWLKKNVIEVRPGMAWRVNSFTHSVTYDVEFVDNACSACELVCILCHYCVHEFTCTCHDRQIKDNMCKHIHAVVKVFCMEGAVRSEEENARRVEDEIEAICVTNGECKVGKEVEKSDMWKPIAMNIQTIMNCFNNADSVPDAVVEGGLKFLEVLRREMPQVVQEENEMEEEEDIILLPPRTPKTPRRIARTPKHVLTPQQQSPGTPKRVSPQRRLFHSVQKKKPLRQRCNLSKPTYHQEGAFQASFAMGKGHQVANVHTDFDHVYTKNTTADTF